MTDGAKQQDCVTHWIGLALRGILIILATAAFFATVYSLTLAVNYIIEHHNLMVQSTFI